MPAGRPAFHKKEFDPCPSGVGSRARMMPIPQIPYTEIGMGIAILLGVWAFFVAETDREKAVIAAIPIVVFLVRLIFPSPAGRLISLIGWMLYGLGCIIFLRYNGIAVR